MNDSLEVEVRLCVTNRCCDGGVCGDGVDRDLETVLFGDPLDQDRNGGGFISLVGDRLLAEHETIGGRKVRNEVKKWPVRTAIMASPGGFAIDNDEVNVARWPG